MSKRKALPASERRKLDDLLLIQLQRFSFGNVETLFTYFSADNLAEPNTFLFTDYMRFRFPNLRVAYPIVDLNSRDMQAGEVFEDTEFAVNSYGLTEPDTEDILLPEDIDVAFVPLLACDLEGYRVGFGKGYYDKFLSLCRDDVLKIGFSYFEPVQEISDINEYDIPLDFCATPSSLYAFE